jgi:hypothetical protein
VTFGSLRAAANRFQSWVMRSGSRRLPSTVRTRTHRLAGDPPQALLVVQVASSDGRGARRHRRRAGRCGVARAGFLAPSPAKLALVFPIERSTLSLPASSSTPRHCKPHSSPRLIHVASNTIASDNFEPRAFPRYAATAIALIGQLPSNLAGRSIDIKLTRRKQTEELHRSGSIRPTTLICWLARLRAGQRTMVRG